MSEVAQSKDVRAAGPDDLVWRSRWVDHAGEGPPGLLAEELDVEQRQPRGNLSQGFVHAALLEAATRLARP